MCVCVHHVCAWCFLVPREGVRSPGTTVTDGCKIPDECWEPNLGPVQEQQALLSAEPSLHPPKLGT